MTRAATSKRTRPTTGGVNPLFAAKLASSGVSPAFAAACDVTFVADAATTGVGTMHVPCMRFGYHTAAAERTPFFRIRLLAQPPSFAAATTKPLRYLQPAGSGVMAYLPRAVDWQNIVVDASRPILVVEGELKALCCCERGLDTIGLGGVFNWKSKRRGIAFLPELEAIVWKGRRVNIAFDSDAATNTSVASARAWFAAALLARGAQVYIVEVPAHA